MITHMNKITNQPPMNSITTRGYINTYVEILIRAYQEPFVVIAKIPNQINDHFVRPNMVVFKYLDFKKDVDLDVHVKILQCINF